MGLIDTIRKMISGEESPLYKAAVNSLNSIEERILVDEEHIKKNPGTEREWFDIYPDNSRSPKVMPLDSDNFVVYFPVHSTPYQHKLESKCKYIRVIKGELVDANSGRVFGKGKTIKVRPSSDLVPATNGTDCYISVKYDDC